MVMRKKITSLVSRGYKEAAFTRKDNAMEFATQWRKKGYTVGGLRSSGPTVEGDFRKKAYYVMAKRKRKRM